MDRDIKQPADRMDTAFKGVLADNKTNKRGIRDIREGVKKVKRDVEETKDMATKRDVRMRLLP